jgi:flagellar hook assembly protein FlgD
VSVPARVAFVLLVAATFAAFFVAQRLKSAPPVVRVAAALDAFSPNGDGVRDRERLVVRVQDADDVTVTVVDADGEEVRRLASAVPAAPRRPVRVVWDGTTDTGARAVDGRYRVRVGLRRKGRSVVFPRSFFVDTTPPRPRIVRTEPVIVGPGGKPVTVQVRGVSPRSATRFEVLRTDVTPVRTVARFLAAPGRRSATWDGVVDGSPAPAGTYLVAASVTDAAGNVGTTPTLPPQRGDIPGKPGISVRDLLIQPPATPVRAGARVRFLVDSRGEPYRWRVRRLGASRPRDRGKSASGGVLSIKAPGGKSGVYLLEARSGDATTAVPFAVQAPNASPILVVLPAITWFGASPVDDDRDGLPNTLATGGPAAWPRLIAGGLPPGLADQIAPLLVFLDRQGIDYDLTTDLALEQDPATLTDGVSGVLLPGPLRWITPQVAQRLRRYVSGGGRLASFGADTLRRGVTVRGDELERPTQPTADDPFGAELRPLTRLDAPAPLVPLEDRGETGLLTGIDQLPAVAEVEESEPSGRVMAALGLENGDAATFPALSLSTLGSGRVIRVGVPAWGSLLATDPQVEQLTRNIADILRGVRPRIRSFG